MASLRCSTQAIATNLNKNLIATRTNRNSPFDYHYDKDLDVITMHLLSEHLRRYRSRKDDMNHGT